MTNEKGADPAVLVTFLCMIFYSAFWLTMREKSFTIPVVNYDLALGSFDPIFALVGLVILVFVYLKTRRKKEAYNYL